VVEFSLSFILSQLLAAAAFGCGIYAFFRRDRSTMLLFWFLSAFLNSCHFALLGQLEAAAFVGLSAMRFLVAAKYRRPFWLWFFLLVSCGVFIVSYQSPLNALPFLAAIVGTVGSFQQRVNVVRLCMAVGASAWIVHNILVGSPMAALMEIAFLSSNLLGFLKHRTKASERSNT